jgi:hypothetical protein
MTIPPSTKRIYEDEKTYVNRKVRIVSMDDLMKEDRQREPEVIPHNTMRFDVHLSHVYGILDDGDVTKEQIATAIRKAIIKAVEDTLGEGLDGIPIPGGAMTFQEPDSVMLHREMISFDFS